MSAYTIHGVVVESEYELDARPAPAGAVPDFTVERGERRSVPGDGGSQPGRLVAELASGDGYHYRLTERESGGWLMRFAGLADFEVDGTGIVVHSARDSDERLAPTLLTGGVIARLLARRGTLVLHASAVEVGGDAIALLGGSGAGKSTTAASLCLAGATLITDDTLAIELDPPRCFAGTTTLRLRETAYELLATEISGWSGAASGDGRRLVHPPLSPLEVQPLAAAVLIRRAPGAQQAALETLGGQRAAAGLLRYPRSLGWHDREPIAMEFRATAELANETTVLELTCPEGSLGPELGAQLLARLEVALGRG